MASKDITKVEVVPCTEAELDEMIQQQMHKGKGYLTKYWDIDKLTERHAEIERSLTKNVQKVMRYMLAEGKILYAIRERIGYGDWKPWCEANGKHPKHYERMIGIYRFHRFYPDVNPVNGLPWSFSAMVDYLPTARQAMLEHAPASDFSGMEDSIEFLTEGEKAQALKKDGRSKPRTVQTVYTQRYRRFYNDIAHQIEDMGHNELAELCVRIIRDMEDLLEKTNPNP